MKKLSFLVPLIAMLFVWTGCKEEKEQLKPDVLLGDVTFNEDNTKAYVTVTPSETSMAWYWKNVEKDGEDIEYTKVSGNESCKLEIPVSPETTYVFSVYSENVAGISDVKTKEYITGKSEATETENFTMKIKNVSPYSLDVDVVKGSACEKYTIAMIPVESYVEDQFIESSKTSFNPNETYPLQPYNWSDENATFNEQSLYKGTLSTSEENKGVIVVPGNKYYIAAYQLDNQGNATVLKEEVDIPAATVDFVTAGLNVTIDIKDEDITNTSVEATFTAPSECKKILVTVIPGGNTYDELTTDEEKNEFISMVGNGINVRSYTGPFSYKFKTVLDYGVEYMVCAIPINEEGKMGNIVCKKFNTKAPELKGEGKIESATVNLAANGNINVVMNPTENVKTVRIYYATEYDYGLQGKDIEMIMADDMNAHLRHDYTVEQIKDGQELYVNHPGDNYYIFASTIDTNGEISKPQNIVKLSDPNKEFIETKAPEEEKVTFDGVGEATLSVVETTNDGAEVFGTFKVVKGEGAVKVYRFFVADQHPKDVEALAQEVFADYPESTTAKELEFNSEGEYVEEFSNWLVYDEKWGGQLLVIVTVDAAGKLKITSYYSAGTNNVVNY